MVEQGPSRVRMLRQGSPGWVRAIRPVPDLRLRTLSATPLLLVWRPERAVSAATGARAPHRDGRLPEAGHRPENLRGVLDRPGTLREVEARGGMEEPRGPQTPLTKTRPAPCVWMTMLLLGAPTAGRATAQLTTVRGDALRRRVSGPGGLGAACPRSRGAAPSGRPRRRMFLASVVTRTTHDSIVSIVVRSSVRIVTTSQVPVAGWPDAVVGSP